jgi:hypothetical protein
MMQECVVLLKFKSALLPQQITKEHENKSITIFFTFCSSHRKKCKLLKNKKLYSYVYTHVFNKKYSATCTVIQSHTYLCIEYPAF